MNKLQAIPECFGNLNSLKFLDISKNSIDSVSESFGNLKNLTTLRIYNNKL